MSYIQKTLLADETLLYRTHKHWVIFLFPAFWTVVGLALCTQKDILVLLGYLVLIVALYYWLSAFVSFTTSEYAVTDRRVLIKTGFVQRQTWETLLSKIATLEIQQTILGRILGYGTLVIQNTGGGKDAFTVISNPLMFKQNVQQQTEKMQVNLPVQTSKNTIEPESIPTISLKGRERL